MSCVTLALGLLAPALRAQDYSIDWHQIAGGGGASSGGQYSLTGTIGQPDAGGRMSGGGYSLTGGFWSMVATVPTPGMPSLAITRSGGSVTISWPDTGNCVLQQSSALAAPGGWTPSVYTVTTANDTCSITVTPPRGNLFFRLIR